MAKQFFLPDGGFVSIPDNMPFAEADAKARQKFPEAYGITQQHGFLPAAKAGLRAGVGAGLKGIGSLVDSDRMQSAGTAMMQPNTEPGAYHPYTDEEVDAKYKKGILSGAGATASKYITEPLGGMVGRYGVPIAVGAAAGALAPELALAGAAGTVLADAPMEIGEDLERREQRQAAGFATPDPNKLEQVASGLATAALLPLAGSLGQKMIAPFMKTMGPSLAETSKLVASGQMTKEAAVAQLNSLGKNVLLRSGEAAVVGPTLMTGTELLRTAQSGEDVTSPEALERYKTSIHEGVALAPLGALGALGMRRGQVRDVGKASDEFSKTYADASQQNATFNEQARRDAAWQAQQGVQQELGLPEPKQPKGGRADYEATAGAPDTGVLTRAFFNQHGVPNRGDLAGRIRAYEGVPLADTAKIAELYQLMAAVADSKNPHAGAYAKAATTLEPYTREVEAPAQRELDLPRPADPNAGKMQDLFTGEETAVDMRPKAPEVLVTPDEIAARKAELYAEFERAHERYKQTGDSTELDSIVAKAREEVGPADEALNQASTQKMFDKRGLPTQGAKRGVPNEPSSEIPASADRKSDGVDVPEPAVIGASRVGAVPEGARSSARVDEQPVMAEKPQQPTLTIQQQIDALALENRTTKNQAKMQKLLAARVEEQRALARNKGFGGLELTDAEKKADAEARASQGANQVVAADSTTGLGRAAKATTLDEFAPTRYALDAPENLDNHGNVHGAMGALWWNDLAQMVNDAKRGTPAEKKLAKEAIKLGRKNKAFTQEQLDKAIETDHRNIEKLRQFGRKSAIEQNRGALLNRAAAEKEAKAVVRETKAAAKAIEQGKAEESRRAAEEAKAEADAERKALTKPDELEADVATLRDLDLPDPDAFMYRATGKKHQTVHTKEAAAMMVKNITSKWKNAPEVAVKDFLELRPEEQKWVEVNKAAGFVDKDGKITIVSDRNTDLHDVKATLFHEALGHYGLRSAFKSELQQMLKDMYDTHPGLKKAADAVRAKQLKLTREQAVEEVLAERQLAAPEHQTLINKVLALIRSYLRKIGMVGTYTRNDVVAVLRQARETVESGAKTGPVAGEQAARVKKAETGEAGTEPATPQVLSRDEVKKPLQQQLQEAWEGKGTFADRAANAFLGNASSLLGKLARAGDNGAWSSLLKGKVSAATAHWQHNNVMTLVTDAMDLGHLAIEKSGFVRAVEDKTHNFKALVGQGHKIREKLAEMGYKEKGENAKDPNTVTNAMAMAMFGPRLEALVKEGQFSKSAYTEASKKMSDTLREDKALRPLLDEFQATYNVLRGHALDAMVESGIKTRKEAQEFMDRSEYLPLYRMDEGTQSALMHAEPTEVRSLLKAAAEQHLGSGSELAVGDPVTNAFNNLTWLNSRAVQNNTARIMMDSLIAEGSAKQQKFRGDIKDPHIVSFNVDGEQAFFRIKDVNDASAFAATPVMTGFGWKIAKDFTNVLRKGITMMPGFVWGQASQDAQRVAIRTGQDYWKAYKDVAKSTVNEMRSREHESVAQKELRSAGVVAARDFVDGTESFRKDMLDQPTSLWHKTIERLERMAAASDGASREAAYNATLAEQLGKGVPEYEAKISAIHAARQLIDFNNRGNSRTLAALMTVVPFVNARIQGTHRMVDALRGKIPGMTKEDAQHMAMRQIGKLAAFTMAYTLINQGNEEYEQETPQSRNNNFMFPGGLKMPVASELLPFKVMAETTARQLLDNPNEDFAKSKGAIAASLTALLMGPQDMMPIIGKPFIEQITNHSFGTGHELVSRGLQNRSASMQYNQSTTEFAKALSAGTEAVAETFGAAKGTGVSPIVLENYLTGFTGRLGQEVLNFTRGLEAAAGARAAPKISELPMVGSFFMNPQGNAARTDFQDVVNAVTAAQADLKALMAEGDYEGANKYRRAHAKLLALQGRITPIQQRLTALNKQLKMGEPSSEKRDRIYEQQQQVLRQVMDLRKQAAEWL